MNIVQKICLTSTLTLMAMASHLQSALPPLYQSLHEYETLIENQDFANYLGTSSTIRNIERSDDGFIINSPKKSFEVGIVYDNPSKIGPADFHFKLPSSAQSLLEYKTLLRSDELKNHLTSGDYIIDIERNDKGFVVTTPKRTIEISVVYDSQDNFDSDFHFVFPAVEHLE